MSKELDPRDHRYTEFVTQRSAGVQEEDIAAALGFDSPQDLYRQLAWDGFPICAWCGAAFAGEEHCEQAQAEKRLEREALYVGGLLNMSLFVFAPQLMTELATVGLNVGGRREACELTYPPGYESGEAREIRLSNDQILLLALDAYREEPFDDERWYGRVEVRGMVPRTDRATLAAVCAFEGSELSLAGRTKKNPEPALDRLRRHLGGEQVPLKSGEERLLGVACALLQHYRPGLDQASEKGGKEILVAVCERVSKIVEDVRRLTDYMEFGKPGGDTRPEIEDAQLAVRAAELFFIEGVRTHREVGRRLGLELSESDLRKGGHSAAAKLICRGKRLFIQGLGEKGWREHIATQRVRLKQP